MVEALEGWLVLDIVRGTDVAVLLFQCIMRLACLALSGLLLSSLGEISCWDLIILTVVNRVEGDFKMMKH